MKKKSFKLTINEFYILVSDQPWNLPKR